LHALGVFRLSGDRLATLPAAKDAIDTALAVMTKTQWPTEADYNAPTTTTIFEPQPMSNDLVLAGHAGVVVSGPLAEHLPTDEAHLANFSGLTTGGRRKVRSETPCTLNKNVQVASMWQ
jgi:hypothetical protein